MVPSTGKKVIYVNGRHGGEVFTYSVETALKLVLDAASRHPDLLALEQALEDERSEVGCGIRWMSWLTDALAELTNVSAGEPMSAMRLVFHGAKPPRSAADPRPEVVCQESWRNELAIWCFNQRVNPQRLEDSRKLLPEENPWEVFSFLAPAQSRFPRGLRLVSGYFYEGANELSVLRRNQWKETAQEENVIARYLRFLNEWGSGNWDILDIRDVD